MEQTQVLVTGGAGFIGSHVVDRLIAGGYAVTVLDIKPEVTAVNLVHVREHITYVEGDIRDGEVLRSLLTPDTQIIHLAAFVSVPASIEDPLGSHDTNVNGTLTVFAAAHEVGVSRVVYASSAAVYGNEAPVPVAETAPLRPSSPYGLHKIINEEYAALYAQVYGLSTFGLRFFNVYGSRQDPSSPYSGVISIFHDRLAAGSPVTIYGDGSATRDFIHVHDVAQACVEALSQPTTGVCNIATGSPTSIRDLYDNIARIHGVTSAPEFAPTRTGDILHSTADTTSCNRYFLKWQPSSLAEGLQELVSRER